MNDFYPYDRKGYVIIPPEIYTFIGIFPDAKAEEARQSKLKKKTSHKNLRQKTISPNSVDEMREMYERNRNRPSPYHTAPLPKVPPRSTEHKPSL